MGHQCVECIRGGNQGARRATGRFGGPVVAGARVTWALIAINLVIFVVELAHQQLFYDWGLFGGGVASGQWYRMLTSAFIPPTGWLGFVDIAFNMWVLYVVGPAVERALGPARYLTVYLVSALGGSALFYLVVQPGVIAGGASGAIFGLFGAWFVLARRLGLDSRQVVMLIVLNLGIGFLAGSYIAWQAHIGGLVAGGLLTLAFAYAPRRNRTLIQVFATVGMIAILIAVVVIRNHQLLQDTYGFFQGRLF